MNKQEREEQSKKRLVNVKKLLTEDSLIFRLSEYKDIPIFKVYRIIILEDGSLGCKVIAELIGFNTDKLISGIMNKLCDSFGLQQSIRSGLP